jgi:uncharacterized protein (TIGR02594 family)
MVVFSAFRRSLVALAMCSAAIAVSTSSASARSYHHGKGRYAHARHVVHYARRTVHHRAHHVIAHDSRRERSIEKLREPRFAHVQASVMPGATEGAATTSGGLGGSDIVSEARRYLGGNPTSRGSLWCARFMNMVLKHTGHRGTGSDMANSFASYGHRVSGPQVGAIAVMGRRGGGHVGIITGIDAHGNPIMISGNNGNRVREAPVSRGRIYAYVMPN